MDRRFMIHDVTIGKLPKIRHVVVMPKTRPRKPNFVVIAAWSRQRRKRAR